MVTHLLAYCWKDNSKKLCWKLNGRKYQIGKACLCIVSKISSSLYVEDIKLAAQGGEEERVVAQSRLARNPVARNLHRSSTVPSSSSSQSLENLTET